MSQTPPPDGWGTPQPPGPPSSYLPPPGYQPPTPNYPPPPGYQPPPPNYQPPYGGGGFPTPPPIGAYGQPGGYGYSGATGALAGWWSRVGATLIDGIIFFVVGLILRSGGGAGAVIAIEAVYLIVLVGQRGQTVGNMALSTRVVDAATGGTPGYGKAAIRWIIELLLDITIIGGILDILWPLWDSRNQTIHDKAAGTLVVRT